jgi:hypothetical protein
MTSDDLDETRAWAAQHEAAWEIVPLHEVVKGQGRTQTGFELRIFAQVAGQSQGEIDDVTDRARRIARQALPRATAPLEWELGSYEDGECERPETGFADEVAVPVELTFEDPAHPPRLDESGPVLAAIEARLRELGLKPRAWDASR